MKVNNFIALFNARTKNGKLSQNELVDCISDLIKPKSYIPYDEKIRLVMDTLESTNDCRPCLPNRNRMFIIKLINMYTNLEVHVSDFDILCQNLFIEPILLTFEREYKICSSIMNMCIAEIGGVSYG